jgi:hypothetical protein
MSVGDAAEWWGIFGCGGCVSFCQGSGAFVQPAGQPLRVSRSDSQGRDHGSGR